MTVQFAVAHVKGLVVHQEANHLSVGDVDDDFVTFRVPVAALAVGKGTNLVDAVQIRTGQPVRITLVEVAAPANVAVRQCEERLTLSQHVEVQ